MLTHPTPPRLSLRQSLGGILEITAARPRLSCVASHVRYNRTTASVGGVAWQGGVLRSPVASPSTKEPPCSLEPGPWVFAPMDHDAKGLCPLDPCAGGRSRAAWAIPPTSPDAAEQAASPKGLLRRFSAPSPGPLEPLRADTGFCARAAGDPPAPAPVAPEQQSGAKGEGGRHGRQ